jgi:hypothetical protein
MDVAHTPANELGACFRFRATGLGARSLLTATHSLPPGRGNEEPEDAEAQP